MPELNPEVRYVFQSVTGRQVIITSRLGEDAARSAAMLHFWGPPSKWCENRGTGLSLIAVM